MFGVAPWFLQVVVVVASLSHGHPAHTYTQWSSQHFDTLQECLKYRQDTIEVYELKVIPGITASARCFVGWRV